MIELFTSDIRPLMQDFLAFTLCGAAFIWGGGPERVVAATWLIVFEISTRIYRGFFGVGGYQLLGVDWFLATTDFLALAIWMGVALYANRNYTLWIAGLQLLAMTAHLARGLADSISPVAYAFMVVAPGWFQLFFLGAGLTRHILRKRKYGEYRSWRYVRKTVKLDLPSERSRSWTALLSKQKVAAQDDLR